MKYSTLLITLGLFFITLWGGCCQDDSTRRVQDFNDNWQFYWADTLDSDYAAVAECSWEQVHLPHDWSIEMAYTRKNTAGCTGYLPGGIGWYRKTFSVPKASKDKVTWIEFDGIYRDSKVWLNGNYIGGRPYGYSAFKLELDKYLNYGKENEIIVKVNRKAFMDSRWYPGSGIYRPVTLVTSAKVHIAHWGTFVTTPKVSKNCSEVVVKTSVLNESNTLKKGTLKQLIRDEEGKQIAVHKKDVEFKIGANDVMQSLELKETKLWSVATPYLYTVHTSIEIEGDVVDEYTTTLGVRSIRFDSEEGFFLNGENMKLKGVCLHADAGAVGAAVPIDVWERRLSILKDAGVNAIRTAHNPMSSDFMDLCDRMGFLVQVESLDEWSANKNKWIDNKADAWKHDFGDREYGYATVFEEWAERDVKDMVRRDRNHPSVIMWSIGNEIEWTFPYYWKTAISNQADYNKVLNKTSGGNLELVKIARQLLQYIKDEDTTRPTTAGEVLPQAGNLTGYCDVVDVTGYNYQAHHYDSHHKEFPERMIYGSENFPQWQEWKDCIDRDYISGIFLWPGISYLGEASGFPRKASGAGLLDLAGFKNPVYYFFKTFWQDEPTVYMATQTLSTSNYILSNDGILENPDNKRSRKWAWANVNNHWNYTVDEDVYVECYTNAAEVELFINGKSLGIKQLENCPDRLLKWVLPFEAGELTAVAKSNGKVVGTYSLLTATVPTSVALEADKVQMQANAYDVVHVVAQLTDDNGNPVRYAEREVRFNVIGDARIIGVDNGSAYSVQTYQSDRCVTEEGKCLLLVQAGNNAEKIVIQAYLDDALVDAVSIDLLD